MTWFFGNFGKDACYDDAMQDAETSYNPEDGADPPAGPDLIAQLDGMRDRLRRVIELRMDPRLHGRLDASDVIQESFMEASQRVDEYRGAPKLPFYLWVRYLTVQKLLQLRRKHVGAAARDVRREVHLATPEGSAVTSVVLAGAFVAGGLSPSRVASQAEQLELVTAALDQLSENDREVLALRHFEHLGNREVAQVLGLEESAASRRYLRAVERLRALLPDITDRPHG